MKSGNILLHAVVPEVKLTIADLGCATTAESFKYEGEGTLSYLAPRQQDGETCCRSPDLWAVGRIACQLLGEKLTFGYRIDESSKLQTCHNFLASIKSGRQIVDYYINATAQIAEACLQWRAEDRIEAALAFEQLKQVIDKLDEKCGGEEGDQPLRKRGMVGFESSTQSCI